MHLLLVAMPLLLVASSRQIPENLESLNDDNLLKNLDDKTVRQLNHDVSIMRTNMDVLL